jgi:hypothetical protein
MFSLFIDGGFLFIIIGDIIMYLKQILFAKFGDNSFTVYKYKSGYLIRKDKIQVTIWNEYDSFAAVIESLKHFECDSRHKDEDGDEIPF